MLSLSTMLKKFIVNLYYNIFEILILNIILLGIMIPCTIFRYIPFQIIYIVLLLIPMFAGIMYTLNNKISSGYKIYYKDVFIGFKKFYTRMLQLALILGFFILTTYSSYQYLKKIKNIFSFTSFILQIIVLLLILWIFMYAIPLIVKEDLKVKEAIKQGMKIFVDNVMYSLGAFIQALSIFILLLITVVGVPLIFSGLLSMFLLENYNNAIKRYKTL